MISPVTTTLDCALLRDLYGTAELRAIFTTEALVQSWLDVEAALAAAEAEVGIVPAEAAERIARECDASLYDLDELRSGLAATKHPLVPLIRALTERSGDAGGWVHWGATTQDIVDTGLVLQARAALVPIDRDLGRALQAAAGLARRYAETPMAGRTHYQHAVPITFGLKAATWADELDRAVARLRGLDLVAQLSGAAGTLATLGADAEAVQEAFSRRLALARADVHWHATRDRLRDLAHALSQVAAAAERIAAEIIRLEATETGEAFEPSDDAHVGSSTMPQKRNPMTCEYVVASARLLRGATGVLADSPAHAGERDMSFWAAEWLALPSAMILCGGIVDKLATVLEGLEVDEARMRANLELTRGLIMAEAAMMALGASIGHEAAHTLVQQASRRASESGTTLGDELAADPEVVRHMSPEELASLVEPSSYLGLAAASAAAVADRVGGTSPA
jgi:adenylosuccinate lyase/3-carboxy-cis,cis-muconate cycloisomerase